MDEKLIRAIQGLLEREGPVIVAIDGPCAAGKTTLAGQLQEMFDCNLFHMDDFFLRPEQRTPERFRQPGGNVDYERFREEVLVPLGAGEGFCYRPFDCKTFTLAQPVEVIPKKLNIIEGSYSHHPYFEEPYDLKVFLDVPQELQKKRILMRPAFLHQRFFDQWIPMENAYFEAFSVKDQADLVL